MRKHELLLLIATAAAADPGVRLHAQSLADVAAAEAARRKAQTAPAKTYTNETLSGTMRDAASSSAPAPSGQTPGQRAGKAAEPESGAATAAKSEPADEKKSEAYWKTRATGIRQSLARTKVLIEAMQSRLNALNADALSADDPARAAALQSDLTTANTELARLKQESEKLTKDLAATEEEARRANVPPGWLR